MSRLGSGLKAVLATAVLLAGFMPGWTIPGTVTIFFDPGSANLSGSTKFTAYAKPILDNFVRQWATTGEQEIFIQGHTDRTGSASFNHRLSCARAASVRAYLMASGIPAEKIEIAGWGERRPLVETPDEVGEPQNRRVELLECPTKAYCMTAEDSEENCPLCYNRPVAPKASSVSGLITGIT